MAQNLLFGSGKFVVEREAIASAENEIIIKVREEFKMLGSRRFLGMIIGLLLFSGMGGDLQAQEKKEEAKPSFVGAVTVANKYLWRGYELSRDSLVIQPTVTLGYQGVEVGLWGNLDTKDRYTGIDRANWNETDLTVSYARELGPVKLTGGYIYYSLDGTEDSQELFLRVTGDFLLSPTFTVYREIAHYPGWYLNLGVLHSVKLGREITLDLAASAGYQISDTDKIVKYNEALLPTTDKYRALHDGLISVGLTVPLGKILTLKPMVGYSLALSQEAQRRIKGTGLSGKENFFFGGLSLTATF